MSRLAPKIGRSERGFTLVELMIALVLGLVVIGGVISVLLSNQQTYRSNQALSQVQDGSRTAFEFLARDIRQAGLTGCGSSVPVNSVLNSTAWWATWNNNTLVGYDSSQTDPAVSIGTSANQRVAGTDSIHAIGADNDSNSLNTNPGATPAGTAFSDATTTAVFNEPTAFVASGDIAIVCDPNQATIFQYLTGSPGNTSNALGHAFANNALMAKLNASDWYIGNNSLGTCSAATPLACSLFRSTISVSGGTASAQQQEIVRGVTNMQLEYLGGSATPTTFDSADKVTDWSKVIAVRVTLTVAVPTNPNNASNPDIVQRVFTNTITLRNRVG